MLFKANAARRHRIPKQRYRVRNWKEYDAALRARGSLTVRFSDEAVERWRAGTRTTPGGQRTCSDLAILMALMLRAVYRLALRQTEGLVASLVQVLGLDLAAPDHSTPSRRAQTVAVPTPPAKATEPVRLLVDSSGMKLCGPGDWLAEKHTMDGGVSPEHHSAQNTMVMSPIRSLDRLPGASSALSAAPY